MTANRKKGNVKKSLYKRIIIKLGTSVVTGSDNLIDREALSGIVDQVAELHGQGHDMIIVSSGAIAAGRHKLGIEKEKKGIPFKQVLASVGQSQLMNVYDQLFSEKGITVAQALLTGVTLADRAGYINARNTLLTLIDLKVICIVNENDVVATDEIHEAHFGDNDNLSVRVANLVDADLLLVLSDITGLYTSDPNRNPEARLIERVDMINEEVEEMIWGDAGGFEKKGVETKLEAAKLATTSGIAVIIANGREPDVILRLVAGESLGTFFQPAVTKVDGRQRWMLSGLYTKGKLFVDSGAALALRKQNKSLLAAGITKLEGDFEQGDVVDIHDDGGVALGCGMVNYSSKDINVIKRMHSNKIAAMLGYEYGSEVVHKDNLVVYRI